MGMKLHREGLDGCPEPCQHRISEFSAAGGFCCAAGDSCGTCLGMSATHSDYVKNASTSCASEDTCGGCGGTWCKISTSYTCVTGGSDPADWCGSAYAHAIAAADSFCAADENSCASCKGKWCTSYLIWENDLVE